MPPVFAENEFNFAEVVGRLVGNGNEMPSPDTDIFKAGVTLVEVAAATVIANRSEKRQWMNNPAVTANGIRLVFVEVEELTRVEVDEKLAVKSEIGRSACEQRDVFAPDFLVIRARNGSGNVEIEVVGFRGVIANPANATGIVVQERRESVDESVVPPRMFEEFGESVFAVDGAVENFALPAVNVAENGHVVLTH